MFLSHQQFKMRHSLESFAIIWYASWIPSPPKTEMNECDQGSQLYSVLFWKHFTPENFQFSSASLPEQSLFSAQETRGLVLEVERCWWNRLAVVCVQSVPKAAGLGTHLCKFMQMIDYCWRAEEDVDPPQFFPADPERMLKEWFRALNTLQDLSVCFFLLNITNSESVSSCLLGLWGLRFCKAWVPIYSSH